MILLLRYWQLAIGATAVAVLSLMLVAQKGETRHWTKKAEQFEKTIAVNELNYRRAADEARARDAANVARVKAEQQAINKEQSDELEARIADARLRAERLRQQLAKGTPAPGSPGAAPVPNVPGTPGQPNQTPGQDGFSVDDRLTATEQALQLDALIKWVKRQVGVEVSK